MRGRTTVTLSSPELLRATRPSVLLERFGRRLKSTVGSIELATSADDDFNRSFRVQAIDIFLSHSWQASAWRKYFTLLLYFNGTPGIAVVMTTCFFATAFCASIDHCEDVYLPGHFYVVVGMGAFCATLLLWHHLAASLRASSTIFLDKVCIHQTDEDL